MIINLLWAGAVALAFAVIFNAPKRVLIPIIILGMIAVLVRATSKSYGLSHEFATFNAAFMISLGAIFFSSFQKVPVLVYSVCSSIVLVPSLYAYKAMIAIIQISTNQSNDGNSLMQAFHYSASTWLVFGAIVLGLIIPMQFFQRYRFRV